MILGRTAVRSSRYLVLFVRVLVNSSGAKFQTTFVICIFYCNKLSFGKTFICKVERLNVKQHRSRWDGSLSRLIWICAVCKNPLTLPVAVKELNDMSSFVSHCVVYQKKRERNKRVKKRKDRTKGWRKMNDRPETEEIWTCSPPPLATSSGITLIKDIIQLEFLSFI